MTTDKDEIERASGNVFADLGLPDAEAHLLKAQLVTRIDEIIRWRGLKQVEAAKLLGLSQPDVSRLFAGQLSGLLQGAPAAPADGAGARRQHRHSRDPFGTTGETQYRSMSAPS